MWRKPPQVQILSPPHKTKCQDTIEYSGVIVLRKGEDLKDGAGIQDEA